MVLMSRKEAKVFSSSIPRLCQPETTNILSA